GAGRAGGGRGQALGLDGIRLARATPGGVRFTVTVPEPKLTRVDLAEDLDQLVLPGFVMTGEPGGPPLPSRTVLVAVPPLGEVRLTAATSAASVPHDLTP